LPITKPHLFPGILISIISQLFLCSTTEVPVADGSLPRLEPLFNISSMLLLALLLGIK